MKPYTFVFWHPKNAISQSPFGILHIVCSSGRNLTHKLLLFRCLPVCLPVSSMLKLRLPQFFFYRTAPFPPWSVGIQSNCCNTISVLRYLLVHFQWDFAQKMKFALWKTIYESLDINYPRHFSGSPAWFWNWYRLNKLVLALSILHSYDHKYHK